jgi:hypothetical protein
MTVVEWHFLVMRFIYYLFSVVMGVVTIKVLSQPDLTDTDGEPLM